MSIYTSPTLRRTVLPDLAVANLGIKGVVLSFITAVSAQRRINAFVPSFPVLCSHCPFPLLLPPSVGGAAGAWGSQALQQKIYSIWKPTTRVLRLWDTTIGSNEVNNVRRRYGRRRERWGHSPPIYCGTGPKRTPGVPRPKSLPKSCPRIGDLCACTLRLSRHET